MDNNIKSLNFLKSGTKIKIKNVSIIKKKNAVLSPDKNIKISINNKNTKQRKLR